MSLFENLLGPPKDEIWTQIAKEIDGEFIDQGFWGTDTLSFKPEFDLSFAHSFR
jgi:hypothetical protein